MGSHYEGSSSLQMLSASEMEDVKRYLKKQSEELTVKLEELLESDDENGLVKLFEDYHTNVDTINSLVIDCVEYGATKCLIALIRGKVNYTNPLFDPIPQCSGGVTPLAYLAHTSPADPYLFHLMFLNCGAASHANLSCTIGSKPTMDSLRVLVKYTDSINDVAWTILKNGGLKQFAALLLIDRKKVLAPFDTGLTVHQYITSEIEEIESSTKGKLSIEQEELKRILRDAQTLLSLFERVGDALSSYCTSIKKDIPEDEVVMAIAGLLHRNQVNVVEMDIHVPIEGPAWPETVWSLLMNECKATNFTPEAAPPTGFEGRFIYDRPTIPKMMQIPELACVQARLYSTRACPPRKIGDCQLFHKMKSGCMLNLVSPNSTPSPFSTVNSGGPRRHLTYIASRLARRIKL